VAAYKQMPCPWECRGGANGGAKRTRVHRRPAPDAARGLGRGLAAAFYNDSNVAPLLDGEARARRESTINVASSVAD
jgi:hypothetical protein